MRPKILTIIMSVPSLLVLDTDLFLSCTRYFKMNSNGGDSKISVDERGPVTI